MSSLALFALNATADLGGQIARELWVSLAPHEEREFEDGEHKARPLDSVEGTDAYVIQSLHSGPTQSAADKLCRLLFFIGALKDAGAARVTAVTPYLCYARKDRRTKARDPVTTRYLAQMFESKLFGVVDQQRRRRRRDRRTAKGILERRRIVHVERHDPVGFKQVAGNHSRTAPLFREALADRFATRFL